MRVHGGLNKVQGTIRNEHGELGTHSVTELSQNACIIGSACVALSELVLNFLLLITIGHLFVTSSKLWGGDRIFDQGTAEVHKRP